MYRKLPWLCLLPAVCLALALTSSAADRSDPDDAKPTPEGLAVEQVVTAFKLVEYGREQKAPEALITAAGMLRQVPEPRPLKAEVTTEGGEPLPKDAPAEKVKTLKEQADELFAEALEMTPQNLRGPVRRLSDAAKARPEPKPEAGTKGALGGPKTIVRVLNPKGTDVWRIPFVGGQPAIVGFRAARVCRISWEGPAGGVIGRDDCMVGRAAWMPVRTATHTLRVRNLSPIPVAYSLFTN